MLRFTLIVAILALSLVACASRAPAQDSEGLPGRNYPDSMPDSMKKLLPLAQGGDVEAQFQIAVMYAKGQGLAPDMAKAADWFTKAAKRGDHRAQYVLGEMYLEGTGVKQDHREAANWILRAAETGNTAAQVRLGELYYHGTGVSPSFEKAETWFFRAAIKRDARAQNYLGFMHERGEGVEQNYGEAAQWYREAADQGLADAQVNLGLLLANGRGVPQNDAAAAKWYLRAAEQGHVHAQTLLGVQYFSGTGVGQDFVKGFTWLNIAARQGNREAVIARGTMGIFLTPAQIAEAQRLARTWLDDHDLPVGDAGLARSSEYVESRKITIRWEGVDLALAGTLTMRRDRGGGQISITLPRDAGNCVGKYRLEPNASGAWSVSCTNGLAASGTLKALGAGKGAVGTGTDSSGRILRFTVGGR